MIIEEEVYLQHFGVRGQKWGVRRAQKKAVRSEKIAIRDEKWQGRTTTQKIGIGATTAIAGFAVTSMLSRRGFNAPVALVGGTAAALAGAKLASSVVDRHGTTPVSEVKRS